MFTLPDHLHLGGAKQRYDQNVAAIRLLHELRSGRTATDADRSVLCLYSGWGDSAVLKYARKVVKSYGHEYTSSEPNDDLKYLVTDAEWQKLLGSTFNAHYTSLDVVRAIWRGVEALGYADRATQAGLRFLDPSAGVGHFYGASPEWLRSSSSKHRPVMVELDALTADVCSHLYPEAEVVCSGFEQTFRERRGERSHSPLGIFDLSISNVPFGKVRVEDPGMKPRAATESLHNYFISRMLELTRPGGLVVAVTSRYSLDGTTSGPVCRKAWAERAKLELSIRLPCDTFKANAGTEVVTDVLFLRRLREGERGNGDDWVETVKLAVVGTKIGYRYALSDGTIVPADTPGASYGHGNVPHTVEIPVSKWYETHPDCVLGVETLTASMYANKQSYGDLTPDAQSADLKTLERKSKGHNRSNWEEQNRRTEQGKYNVEADPERPALEAFLQCVEKYLQPLSMTDNGASEVSGTVDACVLPTERQYEPKTDLQSRWWDTYKAAKEVIRLQVARCTDEELEQAQSELSLRYKGACCGEKGMLRASSPVVVSAFKDRPDIHSFLLALERSDGSKEAIFSRRTIYPEAPAVSSKDPVDAVYRCLDALGKLDLLWVGKACRLSVIDVIAALGDLVYKDPETETWMLTDEYLSGNVRRKLRQARATLRTDDYYARNVAALEPVQPPDLEPHDVSVSLKSTWVPDHVLTRAIVHIVGGREDVVDAGVKLVHLVGGAWALDWNTAYEGLERAKALSTDRASLGWLLQCGLDGRVPLVYDEYKEDGKTRRVMNSEQTVLAQAKLDEVQKQYVQFLWADVDRSAELLEVYNDRFNCFVPRKWDGSFLTFPGMNTEITLRDFQQNGVARVLFADRKNHPAFIWPTGAGKTFGGIAAVEKLLQLGLARKVLICVPKHLVPQWVDDYRRLFPGRADYVLCAGKDSLTKKERGVFLSRASTGGYRVVILSHSQLKAIPVKDETFDLVVREQLEALESEIVDQEALDDSRANVPLKRLQAMKKSLEARLTDRAQRTAKDSSWTVTFEELGFDVFVGDEAQAWKNLQLVTRMGNVSGIRTGNSQISLDFLVKIRHVQRNQGRVLLATATPVANSLAETFVFASYLQHEALVEQGVETPDAFFGAFTRTYSSIELEPSCAAYRVVSRLEFGNIPELVRMLRQSWHVVRPEDLGLKLPQLATEQEIVVQTPGSEGLREYVADIAARVVRIRGGKVEPQVDNMLKVCSDGRWASLVNGPPDGEIRDTKLDRVAENVLRHYAETMTERGAQLVFCDLGTPTGEAPETIKMEYSEESGSYEEVVTAAGVVEQARVYEYVRSLLLRGGIPAVEIAFLQDYQGDPVKLRELYRRVNAGECRVLLGSAPTGMNVQERLCALHHIDPVWRPDWKTQRDGRIVRQGNTFGVVSIYLYLTEGSFDAYMWGLVKAKLRVIEQVTCGDPTVRRIDGDVGEIVLRASEIQAIASGNPKVLTFVGVQNELTKLSALRNEYQRNRSRMEWRRQNIPQQRAATERRIRQHRDAQSVWEKRPQGKDLFRARIMGRDYDSKKEAGEALFSCVGLAKEENAVVGEYCGFVLELSCSMKSRMEVLFYLPGATGRAYDVNLSSPMGVWTAIENELCRISDRIMMAEREIADMDRDLAAIERELPVPWSRASDYAREYARYEALAAELSGAGVSVGEFQRPDAEWVREVEAEKEEKRLRCPERPARIHGVQLRLFEERRIAA